MLGAYRSIPAGHRPPCATQIFAMTFLASQANVVQMPRFFAQDAMAVKSAPSADLAWTLFHLQSSVRVLARDPFPGQQLASQVSTSASLNGYGTGNSPTTSGQVWQSGVRAWTAQRPAHTTAQPGRQRRRGVFKHDVHQWEGVSHLRSTSKQYGVVESLSDLIVDFNVFFT